jgi:hypothetical protein
VEGIKEELLKEEEQIETTALRLFSKGKIEKCLMKANRTVKLY